MSALPTIETAERKELPLPTDLKALVLVGIFGLPMIPLNSVFSSTMTKMWSY